LIHFSKKKYFIDKKMCFSNIYSAVGAGKLFETSAERDEPVENGIVLRSGVVKGVRICENYGDPTPALVLDGWVFNCFNSGTNH
jgi:hypothetical protein